MILSFKGDFPGKSVAERESLTQSLTADYKKVPFSLQRAGDKKEVISETYSASFSDTRTFLFWQWYEWIYVLYTKVMMLLRRKEEVSSSLSFVVEASPLKNEKREKKVFRGENCLLRTFRSDKRPSSSLFHSNAIFGCWRGNSRNVFGSLVVVVAAAAAFLQVEKGIFGATDKLTEWLTYGQKNRVHSWPKLGESRFLRILSGLTHVRTHFLFTPKYA